MLLTIDTELVVDTECQESDFDDEIMLTNPLARQESDFETDIVVTTP
ncbi:MAG: hypothetical protein MJ233_00910 [Mycoplasmoidaceae bacterium]|nr:hypothetical protein [Mycoplasmoidaceae bacterium]